MGKLDSSDPKKVEKKVKKRAKKEAKKEGKRRDKERRKEEKPREKEQQKQNEDSTNITTTGQETTQHAVTVPISAKDTTFFHKKMRVAVSLLPACLKNVQAALEASIRAMILKYTEKIGVLMTFKNIKVISNNGNGRILDELPYMHYQVSFDGLVFDPKIKSKLQGIMTDSFPSHIGVLVLGFFNAMISADKMTEAGYAFDSGLMEWTKEDCAYSLSKGDTVDFLVSRIHESLGVLSIEGCHPEPAKYSNYPSIVPAETDEE